MSYCFLIMRGNAETVLDERAVSDIVTNAIEIHGNNSFKFEGARRRDEVLNAYTLEELGRVPHYWEIKGPHGAYSIISYEPGKKPQVAMK